MSCISARRNVKIVYRHTTKAVISACGTIVEQVKASLLLSHRVAGETRSKDCWDVLVVGFKYMRWLFVDGGQHGFGFREAEGATAPRTVTISVALIVLVPGDSRKSTGGHYLVPVGSLVQF